MEGIEERDTWLGDRWGVSPLPLGLEDGSYVLEDLGIGVKRGGSGKFGWSAEIRSSKINVLWAFCLGLSVSVDGSQDGLVQCARKRRVVANRFWSSGRLLGIGVYCQGRFVRRDIFSSVNYLATDLNIPPIRCAGVRPSSPQVNAIFSGYWTR